MGTLGGYLGIPPAFRTQLPHTEECSAGMDELPRLHASPGKMSPSLQGQTLWLVSHYGTGPMLGLSLPGSPRAFPPREGMGMLFSGLLFYFWGGRVGVVREATGVPKLKRNLLEDIRLGQGLLLPWEDAPISTLGMGRPRHPLVSKRGQKSQRRKKEQL